MSDLNELIDRLSNLNFVSPSTDSSSSAAEEETILDNNSSKNSKQSSTAGNILISKVNNFNLPNLTNFDMAQFKPEYLSCIPQFDGNPNDLNRYLAVCQSIIDTFYNVNQPNDFQNIYLLNSIISKLTGNAKVVLGTQNVTTWGELKSILSRHFADQRDEACLNRDLVMLRQQINEKPSQFYDRIMHILNLLCSYVDLHENSDTAKLLKRNLYNDLALKTFLSGLKEPLGTTIRCMRPKDLPEALQFVTEEYNINYFQNISKISHPKQPTQQFRATQPMFQPRNVPFSTFNSHTPHNHFSQNQSFPSQPIPIRPDYSRIPNRFPTNSQVFKNRPSNTNVFRPNQGKPLPPPTPMSISTRQTNNIPKFNNRPSHFQSQPNVQPKFIAEELYNANAVPCANTNEELYYQDNTDQEYSNYCEQSQENFDYVNPDCGQAQIEIFEEQNSGPYAEPESTNFQNVPTSSNQNFPIITSKTPEP